MRRSATDNAVLPPARGASPPTPSYSAAPVVMLALGLAGLLLWFVLCPGGGARLLSAGLAIAGLAAGMLPPVARRLRWLGDALRAAGVRRPVRSAWVVFALACAYLLTTAALHGRDFFPKYHDQHMYLLQARQLATGRLWYPPHPLEGSFETLYVLERPVYAAMYYPGTALLYAPFVALGLPYWLGPVLVAGGGVAMLYRITTDAIDGAAGALAALI
ncbi:MAG: hypothetical protein ACREIT_09565, partial [Tepidisphaeraceae bacterium]